ncbi:UNVERIFIED_CONTAM: hypothetical protein K2H54_035965 [Gekko kuhli]
MKFFCLLFAVGFFLAVKAHDAELDPEEKLQAEENLESLPELQALDETLQAIQDGVPEDPGNIPQGDSAECTRKGHGCYFGTCPRGTKSVGNCSTMYRCCKSEPDSEKCVGTNGQRGHCFSLLCPRGTVSIGKCSRSSHCCSRMDNTIIFLILSFIDNLHVKHKCYERLI